MANRMVHAHARTKPKGKAGHGIRHMTITPADNGLMAETHIHAKPGKPGQYMEPPAPETRVFSGKNAHKEAGVHVAASFGPPPDAEEAGENEAAGE